MLSGNLRAVIKKDYHFYGNAKSIGILPRGDRRDFGDNYL